MTSELAINLITEKASRRHGLLEANARRSPVAGLDWLGGE